MNWFRPAARPTVAQTLETLNREDAPCGGLVLVADGIGGMDLCGRGLARMIRKAGLNYTTWIVPWCHGRGRWYADLTNSVDCAARAQDVAETIRLYHADRPDVPIFLVGKSGGCAVMVQALERLDAPIVEKAVLLAPALSPGYDLTRALQNTRSEILVHWSPFDVVFLGLGTGLFGTSDRVRTWGAGLVGFRSPRSDAPLERIDAYRKLRQVRWKPGMSTTGYLGGHLGPDSPRFLARYVVPVLRPEAPNLA